MLADELRQSFEQRVAHGSNGVVIRAEMHAVVEHDLVADDPHLLFVGAAVFVGVAVRRLGFVGAEVLGVGQPVLVVVVVRAPVVVLEAVLVFVNHGTGVLRVDDAVLVIVVLGAAIAVL